MTTADRDSMAFPEGALVVGARLCAQLAEELRLSQRPDMRKLRHDALKVAGEFTGRRNRIGVDGNSLTVPQAAELLGVSNGDVRYLLRSGGLEGDKDAYGNWWVLRDSAEWRLRAKRAGTRVSPAAGS